MKNKSYEIFFSLGILILIIVLGYLHYKNNKLKELCLNTQDLSIINNVCRIDFKILSKQEKYDLFYSRLNKINDKNLNTKDKQDFIFLNNYFIEYSSCLSFPEQCDPKNGKDLLKINFIKCAANENEYCFNKIIDFSAHNIISLSEKEKTQLIESLSFCKSKAKEMMPDIWNLEYKKICNLQ